MTYHLPSTGDRTLDDAVGLLIWFALVGLYLLWHWRRDVRRTKR